MNNTERMKSERERWLLLAFSVWSTGLRCSLAERQLLRMEVMVGFNN
jgi:hypothetical protein